MDFLYNPWFIGVGGGIISGVIIAWFSKLLFSGRDEKEYKEKITAAHQEIVNTIRLCIPEGIVPPLDVLDAMLASTARKYHVEIKDMFGHKEIAEDLVKEIMDSSFISAKSKAEFCLKLAPLIAPVPSINVPTEYRERTNITYFSAMMGIFTAAMSMVMAFISVNTKTDIIATFLPMVFAFLIMGVSMFVLYLSSIKKVRKKQEMDKLQKVIVPEQQEQTKTEDATQQEIE